MSLKNQFFILIKEQKKTIELRIFDEKRKSIKCGDEIEFKNIETNEVLNTTVYNIITAPSFISLCEKINIKKTGFAEQSALLHTLHTIYPKEEISEHGVVAIEIKLIAA